ncbi:MAG: hypothetical protein JO200_07140 [Comamonas sp.]|nr:hypothetical protein [Comamonas sp.]
MKVIKYLFCACFIFFSINPHAEENWHIDVHTFSYHFSKRKNNMDWNQVNLGLGLRREFSDSISVQAGFFRNSIDRWSLYAITDWTPISMGNWKAGAYAGIRTNYEKPVMLAGGALLRWQGERYSTTLRLMPKTCNTCSGLISIEFGWKFNM